MTAVGCLPLPLISALERRPFVEALEKLRARKNVISPAEETILKSALFSSSKLLFSLFRAIISRELSPCTRSAVENLAISRINGSSFSSAGTD